MQYLWCPPGHPASDSEVGLLKTFQLPLPLTPRVNADQYRPYSADRVNCHTLPATKRIQASPPFATVVNGTRP